MEPIEGKHSQQLPRHPVTGEKMTTHIIFTFLKKKKRLPHRIDPKSLDTFGETFLGETIDENRPIFSAHPRVDAKRNRLVSFGSHNMKEVSTRVLRDVSYGAFS